MLKVEKTGTAAELRALLGELQSAIARKRRKKYAANRRTIAADILH